MALSYTELITLLKQAAAESEPGGLPDFGLMAGIAFAESGGVVLAHLHNTNGSHDRGLWQINSVHASEFPEYPDFALACYTPLINAKLAIEIWRRQGYRAWSTFNKLK